MFARVNSQCLYYREYIGRLLWICSIYIYTSTGNLNDILLEIFYKKLTLKLYIYIYIFSKNIFKSQEYIKQSSYLTSE